MENVQIIEAENPLDESTTQHVIIEHADGSFTSMLKSTYDAMQAEQSTPNLAANAG